MANITDIYRWRWRSGNHVGSAKPQQRVWLRLGTFQRDYSDFEGDLRATIIGESASRPWQATWVPSTPWRELPNIVQVDFEQSFDENGTTRATIVADNVLYREELGPLGSFTRFIRGWISPFRGHTSPVRPPDPAVEQNDWFRLLTSDAQIRVEQGYGDQLPKTFTGLIDDVDLTSKPDQVTVSGRDFGQVLTDQNLLGHVKSPGLARVPVVFTDRKEADETFKEGTAGARDASSYITGHNAKMVCDRGANDTSTAWISEDHGAPNVTEWVQIRIPHGRYESFYLDPAYDNMECFVSVYARSDGINTEAGKCRVDGQYVDDGWIDLGAGIVPGGHGGHPYMKRYDRLDRRGAYHPFGHKLELGNNSIIRVSFRNLREVKIDGQPRYRAAVHRLMGIRRKVRVDVTKARMIRVEDMADIVKVVLRWAGFKEWEVESTGVRLQEGQMIGPFTNEHTLMDIIRAVSEITGYTFFMGDPSDGELAASIGVPIWRRARIFTLNAGAAELRDDQLLTGIQVKFSSEPLAERIHIRGRVATAKDKGAGAVLGLDPVQRLQVVYIPPWTREGRRAGVVRRHVTTYNNLTTIRECEVAARMVGLTEALQSALATIEIPGNSGLTLDDLVAVRDVGTGLNMRLYISNRSSSFRSGRNGSYKMTLGGALVDAPDVQAVAWDLLALLAENDSELPEAVPTVRSSQPQRRR